MDHLRWGIIFYTLCPDVSAGEYVVSLLIKIYCNSGCCFLYHIEKHEKISNNGILYKSETTLWNTSPFPYLSKLSWIFPEASLKVNGAPGNIQDNLAGMLPIHVILLSARYTHCHSFFNHTGIFVSSSASSTLLDPSLTSTNRFVKFTKDDPIALLPMDALGVWLPMKGAPIFPYIWKSTGSDYI